MCNSKERGVLFSAPGKRVYQGMITGESARGQDRGVNPTRTKRLTNIHAACKDENVRLSPPPKPMLKVAIAYIAEGGLVDVTSETICLRKRMPAPHMCKRRVSVEAT